MSVWPNFFIVGAQRSGTTSLYFYLRQHPDVFMPSVKEPHFFSRVRRTGRSRLRSRLSRVVESETGYLQLFRGGAYDPAPQLTLTHK